MRTDRRGSLADSAGWTAGAARRSAITWCDAPQNCTNSIHAALRRGLGRQGSRARGPPFEGVFPGSALRAKSAAAVPESRIRQGFGRASPVCPPSGLRCRRNQPKPYGIPIALQRTGANGGLNELTLEGLRATKAKRPAGTTASRVPGKPPSNRRAPGTRDAFFCASFMDSRCRRVTRSR
jgi:hypothetical protein